jgi:hypothetical protein
VIEEARHDRYFRVTSSFCGRRAISHRRESSKGARYDAFISYSHALDGRLAPTVQGELSRFAKSWWKIRSLRVFRDETSLSVTPGLWPSIQRALDESEFFILFASPEAAASLWVGKEFDY